MPVSRRGKNLFFYGYGVQAAKLTGPGHDACETFLGPYDCAFRDYASSVVVCVSRVSDDGQYGQALCASGPWVVYVDDVCSN